MNSSNVLLKWAIGGLAALWVSLPAALPTLILFMALDFATGLICASIAKKLDSGESYKGLKRKTLVLLLVLSAHLATKAAGIGYDLGSVVAIAYIVNELISITENCARAGVPVPKVLVDALLKAKGIAWNGTERRNGTAAAYVGQERRDR